VRPITLVVAERLQPTPAVGLSTCGMLPAEHLTNSWRFPETVCSIGVLFTSWTYRYGFLEIEKQKREYAILKSYE